MITSGGKLERTLLNSAARDLTDPLILARQFADELELAGDATIESQGALKGLKQALDYSLAVTDQLHLASSLQLARQTPLLIEPVELNHVCLEACNTASQLTGMDIQANSNCRSAVALANTPLLRNIIQQFLLDRGRNGTVGVRLVQPRAGYSSIILTGIGYQADLKKTLNNIFSMQHVNPDASAPLVGSLNLLMASRAMELMDGQLLLYRGNNSNGNSNGNKIELRLPRSYQMSLL